MKKQKACATLLIRPFLNLYSEFYMEKTVNDEKISSLFV